MNLFGAVGWGISFCKDLCEYIHSSLFLQLFLSPFLSQTLINPSLWVFIKTLPPYDSCPSPLTAPVQHTQTHTRVHGISGIVVQRICGFLNFLTYLDDSFSVYGMQLGYSQFKCSRILLLVMLWFVTLLCNTNFPTMVIVLCF